MVDLSKRRKKISLSFFFFGEGKLSFRGRRRLSFFHFLEKIKDPFFSRSACSCQIPFFSLLFQRGFLQTWALFYRKPGKGFIYVLRFYSRRNLLASRFTRVPLKKNASLEGSRIHSKTPSFFLKIFREPLPPFSLAPKIKMLLPPKM